MLGIGVTTRNRPRLLGHMLRNLELNMDERYKLVVIDDASDPPAPLARYRSDKRLGVAKAKTACLWRLQECDPIILLDDDFWPISKDWHHILSNAARSANVHHLVYVPDNFQPAHFARLKEEGDCISYTNCAGEMLYITAKALSVVGAFGEYPGFYGFEHAGYSQRIWKAGLQDGGRWGPYVGARDFAKHVWACDFQGFPEGTEQGSSMTRAEIDDSVRRNLPAFARDQSAKFIPLYDPLEEE